MVAQPKAQPVLHAFEIRAGQGFVRQHQNARAIERIALDQFGNDVALPAQTPIGRQHEFLIGRAGKAIGPIVDFGGHHLIGCRA